MVKVKKYFVNGQTQLSAGSRNRCSSNYYQLNYRMDAKNSDDFFTYTGFTNRSRSIIRNDKEITELIFFISILFINLPYKVLRVDPILFLNYNTFPKSDNYLVCYYSQIVSMIRIPCFRLNRRMFLS